LDEDVSQTNRLLSNGGSAPKQFDKNFTCKKIISPISENSTWIEYHIGVKLAIKESNSMSFVVMCTTFGDLGGSFNGEKCLMYF